MPQGRVWLFCDECHKVQRCLLEHWNRSDCGPVTEAQRRTKNNDALKRAKNFTKNGSISQNQLTELSQQTRPLHAICQHLGVVVTPKQRNQVRKKNEIDIITHSMFFGISNQEF